MRTPWRCDSCHRLRFFADPVKCQDVIKSDVLDYTFTMWHCPDRPRCREIADAESVKLHDYMESLDAKIRKQQAQEESSG